MLPICEGVASLVGSSIISWLDGYKILVFNSLFEIEIKGGILVCWQIGQTCSMCNLNSSKAVLCNVILLHNVRCIDGVFSILWNLNLSKGVAAVIGSVEFIAKIQTFV